MSDLRHARLVLEEEAVPPVRALTALRQPAEDANFLQTRPSVADYAAVAAGIGYAPPHLPNLLLQEFLGETGVRVLNYDAVCKWMDKYVYPLDAGWFWSPLRPKDAEGRRLEGYSARGRDRWEHTHGHTDASSVYEKTGHDVPIHILSRVGLIERGLDERGFEPRARFFVSDFEVRRRIPRASALDDPFLMVMAEVASAATLMPFVIGQWDAPCLVDPDPDSVRYARAAARRQGHRPVRSGTAMSPAAAVAVSAPPAKQAPVTLTLLPAPVSASARPRLRLRRLTVWEWVLLAALLLAFWACR